MAGIVRRLVQPPTPPQRHLFETPQRRHCGQAMETSYHRAVVHEQARQRHPGGGHDQRGVGVNRR
jgi:hypothetical protein